MSITLKDGTVLPDAPSKVLTACPYLAVVHATPAVYGADFYVLFASEKPMYSLSETYTGQYPYIVTVENCYTRLYSCTEGGSAWEFAVAEVEQTLSYPYENADCLVWSNHDILAAIMDADENFSAGEEVVYSGSGVIILPDEYIVTREWLCSMGSHARRLSGSEDVLTTYEMDALFSDTKKRTKTCWVSEVTVDIDTTNEVLTVNSNAENIMGGPQASIHFQFQEYPVVANFPSAEKIGSGVLQNNQYLKTVSAPLAETIENVAFSGCPMLENVEIPSARSIGGGAFSGCTSLVTISLPAAITLDSSFRDCAALTEMTLPAATTVGDLCFYNCTSLKKIDFYLVETLGYMVFTGCTALTTVIIRNTNSMCELDSGYSFPSGVSCYVPSALLADYQADDAWITSGVTFATIEDNPDICGTTT